MGEYSSGFEDCGIAHIVRNSRSTVEQLQCIDVSNNNNMLAISFELRLWSLSHIDGYIRHNTLSNIIGF